MAATTDGWLAVLWVLRREELINLPDDVPPGWFLAREVDTVGRGSDGSVPGAVVTAAGALINGRSPLHVVTGVLSDLERNEWVEQLPPDDVGRCARWRIISWMHTALGIQFGEHGWPAP